jgi:hypothetical protein
MMCVKYNESNQITLVKINALVRGIQKGVYSCLLTYLYDRAQLRLRRRIGGVGEFTGVIETSIDGVVPTAGVELLG